MGLANEIAMPRKLSIVAVLGLFLAWFLLLRPAFLGGPASYIIVAGASMEPTLHSGDLALARQQAPYQQGDIVAFRVPEGEPGEGHIVIHRIVGGTAEEGYIIQGDNKEQPDRWHPTSEDILGRMWFNVPLGGLCVFFLRQPIGLGALAGFLGMFLVLSGGEGARRGRRRRATRSTSPRTWPGWSIFVLGLLIILALSFAALAVFSFRQPTGTIAEPARLSLLAVELPVATARWLSTVGFGLTGGAAAGGLALAALSLLGKGEAGRIHFRYGSLIITVAQVDLKEEVQRISVASIKDLLKLAQRDGRMILHQEVGPHRHLYFIPDGDVIYQYTVAEEGSVAEHTEK